MARTNIDIIVTVRDGASSPLDKVNTKIKDTGKAASETAVNITQLNRTLFSMAAFIGAFAKGMGSLTQSVQLGSELDKTIDRFEATMGPRGEFVTTLRKTSNIVLDEATAMRAGMQLGMLGISKDSKDAARQVTEAAVAAAMQGKDTKQGIIDITKAREEGNLATLMEYGIINKNNFALQAQIATINKLGGIYGNAYVKQQLLSLTSRALTEHTRKHMFMMLSAGQVVENFGNAYANAKQHIGSFLAHAVRPLLEKMIPLLERFADFLETSSKTNKEFLFLAKTVLVFTGVVGGLIGVLGTLSLAVKVLGFAGVGLPGLLIGTLALVAGFVGLTKGTDSVIGKLKILGAIFKGIYELVTNLDPETGMSKLSASTKALLEEHGLLGFVKTVSRILSFVYRVGKDIINVLRIVGTALDKAFGGVFGSFVSNFSKFTSSWTTWWTSDAINPVEKFARAAAVIIGGVLSAFAISKLFGGASKLLSKVPVIGGLFRGGSGPKGTASDPIYTVSAGGLVNKAGGNIFGWITSKLKDAIIGVVTIFRILGTLGITRTLGMVARTIGGVLSRFLVIGVFLSAALGIFNSIKENASKWGTFFTGIADMFVAEYPIISKLFSGLTWVAENFLSTVTWITDNTLAVFGLIYDGWKNIFDWLAHFAEKIGITLSEEARKKNPKAFEEKDKASAAKTKGHQTFAQLTTENSDDSAIMQAVGEQMKTMGEVERRNMQAMAEAAFSSQEKNGRNISPEELANLQALAHAKALREDPNLIAMGEKAREAKKVTPIRK